MPTAQEIIKELNLTPHPEGGFYIQTFIDSAKIPTTDRAHSTCIYYLLEAGIISRWHRVVDAVEIWHYYAGAPLQLSLSWDDGKPIRKAILGSHVLAGERPQVVVEANEWQRAESLGEWTLVGCTVSPGFLMEKFEMPAEGWEPRG